MDASPSAVLGDLVDGKISFTASLSGSDVPYIDRWTYHLTGVVRPPHSNVNLTDGEVEITGSQDGHSITIEPTGQGCSGVGISSYILFVTVYNRPECKGSETSLSYIRKETLNY